MQEIDLTSPIEASDIENPAVEAPVAEGKQRKPLGIIQSRGLGDIIIALPIARAHWEEGYDIYWPICEPFIASFRDVVPWVNWMPVPVDPQGLFFLDTPLKLLAEVGITQEDQMLYLYQYLSSVPERTDPDLFAMMKFDQYKYAVAGVPFKLKWQLSRSLERDYDRENAFYDRVITDRGIKTPYCVYQVRSSDVTYEVDLSVLPEGMQAIEITEDLTDSIFDWLTVIENADTIIMIDSVFANLIDQLGICQRADKYFMRKWNRRVDGNPVLASLWHYIPVTAPEGVAVQSLTDVVGAKNPAVGSSGAGPNTPLSAPKADQGSSKTYSPFGATAGGTPSNFMHAVKQGQASTNVMRQAQTAPQKPNSAQQLLAGLGLRQ